MYFNPAVYVTEDSYLATYNVMRLGDIAFEGNRSKRFAHGRFVENTIGDGIVSHVFKVFRHIGDNYDLSYWKYAINNEKLMRDVLTRSTKASTMMHELVTADFLEESTLVPSLNEQRAIGAAIDSIDRLITLHQCKCQYRSLYGYLSWEQRKLGDCFEFLKSNTLSRAGLNGENGTARNVHYGDILIKFGDCLDGERSDLPFITDDTVLPKFAGSILREGDVIFADTAEDEAAGKCVELRKLPKEPTISGLHTIPARPRFPFGTGYLGHYLNSDAYHRQLLPLMQGIKVISVSKAALQDTQVRFPGLSEQTAIGAALSEVDALITLHQREPRFADTG